MHGINWELLFSVMGLVLLLVGTSGGLVWKIHTEVGKVQSENSKKIGRVYERLDEERENAAKTYTSKEVCGILHKQLIDQLDEIKSDVKEILRKSA